MNTSYPRKFADLARAFVRSPRDLPAWLRHLPAWGRQPVDFELPWFSFGAIRFLDARVTPRDRVFEFGSGGSTFFFARRAARVISMESHAEWHGRVQALARARGITNLECELHPLGEAQLEGYRQNSFFERVQAGPWNFIVIDCFCGFSDGSYGQLRRHAFELSVNQLVPGGMIILDDSWLYPELVKAPRPGWEVRDFIGPGPSRYGVTSTAVFIKQ